MDKPKVRRPWERKRAGVDCSAGGRTKQAFREDCDLHVILKRHAKGGEIRHLNPRAPRYGDFTNATDYQDACNRVLEAKRAFAELPATIRDRFQNSPVALLEFLEDEENRDEAVQLGLLEEPEVEPSEPDPGPPAVAVPVTTRGAEAPKGEGNEPQTSS